MADSEKKSNVIRAVFGDKLVDLITGMGGARDRTTTTSYGALEIVTPDQIRAMYRSDWVARKMVDIVPQDMTREGRLWKAKKNEITAIEDVENLPRVNLWPRVNEALTRARLHGGCAIYIGVDGQDPRSELRPETVGKGDLKYLNVVSRDELTFDELDRDPSSLTYKLPRMWKLRNASSGGLPVEIHPSRIVPFVGARILERHMTNNEDDVWGDSILQVVYDAVRNAATAQQHIAGLVPDSRTDVIYVPGLGALLQDPRESEALTKRFALARTMKSSYNMLLLEGSGEDGEGEKWEQRTTSFSQLPELMQKYLEIAAGAADIPITRFLGQSPGGENSTGEADMRNYYDHVRALQNLALGPGMRLLDRVIVQSALGTWPEGLHYEWAPLWAMTETEKAEVLEKTATSARKLAGTGQEMPLVNLFALSDATTNAIVEAGLLPGLEGAVEKHGTLDETLSEDALDPVAREQKKAKAAAQQAESRLAANQNARPTRTGTNDARPRSMYVRRQLLNTSDLVRWASDAGIVGIMSSDQLHVTVMYSKTPLDWLTVGSDWWSDDSGRLTAPAGGPRVVERLGPTATVLSFHSAALRARHMQMREYGAVSEFDDYVAHVTLSHEPQTVDVDSIVPYRGSLRFGPEIFEEVDENWRDKIK